MPGRGAPAGRGPRRPDPNLKALQEDLGRALGLKVTIDPAARGAGGRMTIAYKEPEQLDALIGRLRAPSRS